MVVQESDKKANGIAVCAEDAGFHLLAILIHAVEFGGRELPLDYRRQFVEQRIVEGGIHADRFALGKSVTADEMGDLFLGPPDLPKGEEVFLADTLGKFADGVSKVACKKWVEVHQGYRYESHRHRISRSGN